MSNAASQVRIGHIYYSGNSYNPTREELLAVGVDACDVPAVELRGWSVAYSGATPPATFVRVHEVWDEGAVRRFGPVRHVPTDVWNGTRHESHDAMIAAHVASQSPASPWAGAQLPGGR